MDPISQQLMMGAAGSGGEKLYVEDVFSTWLYTGNGNPSIQTITNGIDLSGKGGLVWFKPRSNISGGENGHQLWDTARGTDANRLQTNTTGPAGGNLGQGVTSFNNNGVSFFAQWLNEVVPYASWTFRKAAKFFDVVTWVGDGTNRTIAHNLGSVPGCIIIKCTNTGTAWPVYHRGETRTAGTPPRTFLLELNTTAAAAYPGAADWIGSPTSTTFDVGTGPNVNSSGNTYVAYLFAHDAGGFGDSGNDNVISCGTFTGDSTVTLGWEPQWVLFKRTDSTGNWRILDNMRGMPVIASSTGSQQVLFPNTSGAESTDGVASPTSTGFTTFLGAGTYIYIAIRRGPMKTPTDATKVFALDAGTNGTSGGIVTTGFPVDMDMTSYRSLGGVATVGDRLRGYGNANTVGTTPSLLTSSTGAEVINSNPYFYNAWNTTVTRGSNGANPGGSGIISWFFRRAPGFFDVVAYTGTGVARTVSHNLGVVPELMIVKERSNAGGWDTYAAALGNTKVLFLHDSGGEGTSAGAWNNTSPTASVFTVGVNNSTSSWTYIAYLFASCPGVSKVGSYTGTGTTLSVDCGFTNGARFVMIKRTDSTGDWYVWDTARGIVSGNDSYLLLNSTAAEVTNTDYIDPLSSGFQISSTAPAAINANGGSFIFLAVA